MRSAGRLESSRRQVLMGAGLALAGLVPARAQVPDDGFRLLHAQVLDGDPPALGFDGAVPGPTLRARRGEELKVRLINGLSESMTVHWHGLRIPNTMDGVPHLTQEPVAPGASFDYRFRLPDAGTFWYHAHPLDQRERGLYGTLIVDEPDRVEVDQDITFLIGPRPPATVRDVPVRANERLRLRLLNARTGPVAVRVDGHNARVMAVDGQPAEPFLARNGRVALGPGNRLDVFVDTTQAPGATATIVLEEPEGERAIGRLVYDAAATARPQASPAVPSLPANQLPERMDFRNAFRRDVVLEEGLAAPAPAPLFTVKQHRVVMLALVNRSSVGRAVHLHGHACRLLDRLDDGWKPFWLDSILVPPRETARIAFVADNPGKWLIEGHPLGRPETTVSWFEVG